MAYEVCSRCKRRPQDGHDSWCDGSPVVLDTPGPAPMTVRWGEPSYVEPVKAPQAPVGKATDTQKAKARTAATLAAKLAKQAAKKAEEEARAAKEREEAEAKRQAEEALLRELALRKERGTQRPPAVAGICDECGGSLAGKRRIARFCSNVCKERAYKRRVGTEVNNARKVAWLRRRVRETTPPEEQAGLFVCSDCGQEKPGIEFGKVRKGRRMKRCRDCHSGKVIAGLQRKKDGAAHRVAVELMRSLQGGYEISPTVRSALIAWLDSDAAQADGELLAIAQGAQVG